MFVLASCSAVPAQPRLSRTEVLRIADTAAQSQLRGRLQQFQRSAAHYSSHRQSWAVIYKNRAGTAPSDLEVEISDATRQSSITFGDAR